MIDDNYFQEYLILKKEFDFKYKGIELGKVLSHDIARIAFNQNDFRAIDIIQNFLYKIDFTELRKSMEKNKIICIYSVDRADYKYQISQTLKSIESYKVWIISDFSWKKNLNILGVIRTFGFVFSKSWKKNLNILQILFLISRIVYYKNLCDQLYSTFERYDNKENLFLSFNSAFTVENILIQFFKRKNIRTASLSHSFFSGYKNFIPLDIINGENISSDKIWVWGNSSKNNLVKYFGLPEHRVEIAGNPKYPSKPIIIKQSFKKAIVLLGRKIYEKSNLEILDILKELTVIAPQISFELKLHLSLDSNFYIKQCESYNITVIDGKESLVQLFESGDYDFAIVNNSTAYYEAMYYDMICFRYEPSENEIFEGLDDYFYNAISLLDKISTYRESNPDKLSSSVEKLLTDTIGMGINRYKELLS